MTALTGTPEAPTRYDVRASAQPADPELVSSLSRHGSATVHEAFDRRGAMDRSLKPLAPGMRMCGTALTVRCPTGDNLMLIKAISMVRPGDVVVADMGRTDGVGPFGEVLAVECVERGAAGVVLSGSARDSLEIVRLGLPVFVSGVAIEGTSKAAAGSVNHTISCGGQVVRPGDIVVGDADGLVVIPQDEAPRVLARADERVAGERAVMVELRAGRSLFELYGYQTVFDRLGIRVEPPEGAATEDGGEEATV